MTEGSEHTPDELELNEETIQDLDLKDADAEDVKGGGPPQTWPPCVRETMSYESCGTDVC